MTVVVEAMPQAVAPRGSRRRIAALFAVALGAALVAAWAGGATAKRAVPHRKISEPGPASANVAGSCPRPSRLRPAFEHAPRATSLPLSMLVAVGKVESNLRTDARSEAGARGILQLLPSTAAALQLNVDDPGANVLGGARYLRQMLDRFSSTDLALAAYNAGPAAVDSAGVVPSSSVETDVANVTHVWRSLAGCT